MGAINQAVIFLIAALIGGYVYLDRTAAKTLMLAMEAAGAIASVYAILQYAGWDPLIPAHLYTLGSKPAAVRPPATLTQATYFATFLLPAILIAIGFWLCESSSRRKRVHETVLLLSITALVFSGTRSALLGLAGGACALMYLERARVANLRALARAGFRLSVFAAVAAMFLSLPAGKSLRVRLAQWATDRAGGPRLLVWRDSLPLIWQHPVLGIGPEMFEEEFRREESLELARAYPDHYHESPHNFFLEAAISQGLIGLAIWLALLGLALRSGAICCRAGNSDDAPELAALVAMLISLQFCPLTMTNELYVLALSAMSIASAARPVAAHSYRAMWNPALTGCLRAVSIALVLTAAAYVAQMTLYALVESHASRGDLAGAEGWYEAARKFPMAGPNLAVSRQIASFAPRFSPPVRQEALATAKRAAAAAELGSAERFNALYQSAVLAIITRDLPLAERKLRAATDAAPTWYRARMALACVLWWQGRNQEAQRESALALECAGRLRPYVKRTLDGARAQAQVNAAARPAP